MAAQEILYRTSLEANKNITLHLPESKTYGYICPDSCIYDPQSRKNQKGGGRKRTTAEWGLIGKTFQT